MKQFFVYMLASKRNGTIYIGMTSNLVQRIWQHKEKSIPGFTERHDVARLVYFVEMGTAEAAITKEKQLKKWNRARKMRLIEEKNLNWDDLYDTLFA